MSAPRPSEADVEALCALLVDWLDDRSGDTPRETARRILASDWLAARDAEHEREVAALRSEQDEARRVYADLHEEWGREVDHCEAAHARAEAAERVLADRDAAIKALRAGIWELGELIHGDEGVEHVEGCQGEPTCFACILDSLRALLSRDDASGAHDYLSTACLHGRHDECRRVCKFCPAECRDACHDAAGAGGGA